MISTFSLHGVRQVDCAPRFAEERILASGTSFITASRKLHFHFGPIPDVVITPIPLQPFMKVMDLRDMQACPYHLCRLGETAGLISPILHLPLILSCFSPFNLLTCMHIAVTQLQELKQHNNYSAISWQSNSGAQ